MFRKLISLMLVLTVLSVLTFAVGEETSTLSVAKPMGTEEGIQAFQALYPQVTIKKVDGISKDDIFTFVLTQSSDIDIFGSNTYDQPTYRELISRGFYSPIKSQKLKEFASNCYPGVKDVLFVDDQLVGIPVMCLHAYQLGVEKSMWHELGLKDEDLPQTWVELIEFIQNDWPTYAQEHPDWCAMDSSNYWLLFYEMLDDYSVYRRQTSPDPGYDTEEFRSTMEAYLSIDPNSLPESGEKTALFTTELQISPETPDIYSKNQYEYIPVSFYENSQPKALVVLGLMVISPYTENEELCEAYLECMVDEMDPVQRASLQMNCSEPVATVGWDAFFEEYTQTVENYQKQIESVADFAEKQDLQNELNSYIEWSSDLLNNHWMISEESLQSYQQSINDQIIMWDDALNDREIQLFEELCENVFDRSAPVDVIVSRLNRLYYYKTLEDDNG